MGKPHITQDEFEKRVEKMYGDEYTVVGKYINTSTHIRMKHNKCGLEWDVSPNNFSSGYRCSHCFRKPRKTHEHFLNEIREAVGDEYQVLEKYVNKSTKIGFLHNSKNCGKSFQMRPNDFLSSKNRCPHCAKMPSDSKGVLQVRAFLINHGIHFKEQQTFEECKYKRRLRFDFCIFDPNTDVVLLFIEFDGKQHFYSTFNSVRRFEAQQLRDGLKDKFAEEYEIPMIRITYKDLNTPSFLKKLEKVQRLSARSTSKVRRKREAPQ
jgi:hypothetical protein